MQITSAVSVKKEQVAILSKPAEKNDRHSSEDSVGEHVQKEQPPLGSLVCFVRRLQIKKGNNLVKQCGVAIE